MVMFDLKLAMAIISEMAKNALIAMAIFKFLNMSMMGIQSKNPKKETQKWRDDLYMCQIAMKVHYLSDIFFAILTAYCGQV